MKQKIFTILVVMTIIAMLTGSALAAKIPGTTLHGSAPAWANSKNYVGAADANAYIGFRVYLGWQNASGAEALARAVSDPHSTQYGQYLTPQQFRRQFAPSQPQVGAVQSWLKSQGFSVNY